MKWITESAKRSRKLKDKYTMRGTDIYIQDPVGDHINLEFVFDYIMARVPTKLLNSVDVIYVVILYRLNDIVNIVTQI